MLFDPGSPGRNEKGLESFMGPVRSPDLNLSVDDSDHLLDGQLRPREMLEHMETEDLLKDVISEWEMMSVSSDKIWDRPGIDSPRGEIKMALSASNMEIQIDRSPGPVTAADVEDQYISAPIN